MATAAPDMDDQQAPEKPKKSRRLIIVLALLIVLGGAGGAAAYFMNSKSAEHAQKTPVAETEKPPVFLPMEAFTVNLQSENGEQFLQTAFTLQVANQEQVDLIKLYMPNVRSRLLFLLSGKKASDILTIEGKHKLTQEIIDVFKQPFTPKGPTVNVISVLFTSFVVQ